MRRILTLPVAVILAVGAASSVVAAPPTHESVPSEPLEFAAGEMCSFAIRLEVTATQAKSTTFAPGPNGDQRTVSRGVTTNRATNLDTGETWTRTAGSRISVVASADGSLEFDGTGGLYAFYFVGDQSDLGPGLHSVSGHVHESYGPDGSFLGATFRGTSVDLCEVLA